MKYVSSRLAPVKPSASVAVSQNAKALKAAGHDVIDLGLGEPDFATPPHIVDAAYAAAQAGQTKYTATEGTLELRDAVADKFRRENGLQFGLDEVIICNGAKQVIFDALMASMEEGDEVLLCAPYFGQYADMVLILGGTPIALPCPAESDFRLSPDVLRDAITPSTRWVIFNSPSNPAGAVYSAEQLSELGAVLKAHPDVMIMSDEIYEHILFDGRSFVSFGQACPELRAQTLIVNGVSKAYAMTGWRIGYAGGPAELIKAMTTTQSQITSGPCAVAQAAALTALSGPQDSVAEFRSAFERRRDLVVAAIEEIPGLTLDPPGGAFYAFVGCAALIGATTPDGDTLADDIAVTQYLLNEGKVAAVPGSAYGLSPFFRLSTATSDENLAEAMKRIAFCLAQLKLSA